MLVVPRLGRAAVGEWLRQWPTSEESAEPPPRIARVRVGDGQMLPWLRPDDDVLVGLGLTPMPGDLVVASAAGRVVVRFVQERRLGWYLTAVRATARSVRVDETVEILGVVLEVAYRP